MAAYQRTHSSQVKCDKTYIINERPKTTQLKKHTHNHIDNDQQNLNIYSKLNYVIR